MFMYLPCVRLLFNEKLLANILEVVQCRNTIDTEAKICLELFRFHVKEDAEATFRSANRKIVLKTCRLRRYI